MWVRWASYIIPDLLIRNNRVRMPVVRWPSPLWIYRVGLRGKISVRRLFRSDHADGDDMCVAGCWSKIIIRQWIERRLHK